LRNRIVSKRPFLDFVTLRDFANRTRFPRTKSYKRDISPLYLESGFVNFPNTRFLALPSPTPTPTPGLVPGSVPPRLGAYKPTPADKFYGFDHPNTPANFDWKEYVEQTETKLRQNTDPDQKYMAFKDLFVEDAYKYVTEYEAEVPDGDPKTFEGLRDLVQTKSPLATREAKNRHEFDRLVMGDNTEEGYVRFQRDFGSLVTRIGGYTDQMKREQFCKKLSPALLKRIVDNDKCPEVPYVATCFVPDTDPPVPFTYDKLTDLASRLSRKGQSLKTFRSDTPTTSRNQGNPMGPKRLKREMRRMKRQGTAKMEAMYTEAERAKIPEGKNGTFKRDGTVKTCNNCNSPDHLASDCPHGPKRMSAQELQRAKSGTSAGTSGRPPVDGNKQKFPHFASSLSEVNLPKKQRAALKAAVALFQSSQGSANQTGSSTPSGTVTVNQGNGQAAVAGNQQQLSGEQIQRILSMKI